MWRFQNNTYIARRTICLENANTTFWNRSNRMTFNFREIPKRLEPFHQHRFERLRIPHPNKKQQQFLAKNSGLTSEIWTAQKHANHGELEISYKIKIYADLKRAICRSQGTWQLSWTLTDSSINIQKHCNPKIIACITTSK